MTPTIVQGCTSHILTHPGNENANRLLREFHPKGYDFVRLTEEDLDCALYLINHRPRKCLGWEYAHEAFMNEVSHLA